MEGRTTWKTVKVVDGEMEEVEEYFKLKQPNKLPFNISVFDYNITARVRINNQTKIINNLNSGK